MKAPVHTREPIAMCFSGGKDSAIALHEIRRAETYVVKELLTTVTIPYDRVTMHGVRRTLVQKQADAIGIPITEVAVPPSSSNTVYEREMGYAFARLQAEGIRRVAFGDIFLEDLRVYREEQLAAWNLECFFPIWKRDTTELAQRFVTDGFRAVVACVTRRFSMPLSPAAHSMRLFWRIFRRGWIHAARTASFTRSCSTGRFFNGRCVYLSGRSSNVTASYSATSCRIAAVREGVAPCRANSLPRFSVSSWGRILAA